MPKVSIVVPVYNVEQYLPNFMESLLGQTLGDIEAILVDDGSPDGCPALCDAYADGDPRVRVIHKPNGGVSAARNDGLAEATGDYIIFCDSDDWFAVDGIAALYEAAVASGADVTIGDVFLARGDESKPVRFYAKEFCTEDTSYVSELIKADIYRAYCPDPPQEGPAFGYGGPWNKLVRRELLLEHGIEFDTRLKGIFDDILYTAHMLAHAKRVRYVQHPIYHYRIVENSLTHAYRPNVVEVNRAIFTAWEELFAELDDSGQYQEAYYACVMRRTEEAIRTYFGNESNPSDNKTRRRELSRLLKDEPYRSAIKGANLRKLSKKQVAISLLGRLGLTASILPLISR